MKKYLPRLSTVVFLGLWLALEVVTVPVTGCKSTLAPGGAYAPAGLQPDKAFYVADAAFALAYAAVDGAFKFESDNRVALFTATPNIKHTIDAIRPQAVIVRNEYITARAAYMTNPVQANLTTLQSILSKIQQLAVTAQAVLPK